jgi:hypothetical protein
MRKESVKPFNYFICVPRMLFCLLVYIAYSVLIYLQVFQPPTALPFTFTLRRNLQKTVKYYLVDGVCLNS